MNTTSKIRPGDRVRITDHPVKDAYAEIWHNIGDVLIIKSLTRDGNGVMFESDLGTTFENIEKIDG